MAYAPPGATGVSKVSPFDASIPSYPDRREIFTREFQFFGIHLAFDA